MVSLAGWVIYISDCDIENRMIIRILFTSVYFYVKIKVVPTHSRIALFFDNSLS